jgi:hypothetical protein
LERQTSAPFCASSAERTDRGGVSRAGDATGARDELATLLSIRERVLGPDHPDTLAARAALAYWTMKAGDAG